MRRALVPAVVSIALSFACGGAGSANGPSGGSGGASLGTAGTIGAAATAGAGISGSSASGVGGSQAGAQGVSGGGTSAVSGAPGSGGASAGTGTSGAGTSVGGTASDGGSGAGTASAGAPSGGSGGSATGAACTRESLQAAAKSLADALTAKDPSKMPLDSAAKYFENMKASEFGKGIWEKALTIAFQRDFMDVPECQTFSEIIVTQGTKYVLGVQLKVQEGKISEVNALVTNEENGWLFDADDYAKYSKAEDWSVIPEAERDTRETLIAAGNAYFDRFDDENVEVPWGTPCARLEGGAYTDPNNSPTASCAVGIPSGVTFADKKWVVDRDLGTAIGIVRFGGSNGLPDSHMFRSLKGKLRYVHTITVCPAGGCNVSP